MEVLAGAQPARFEEGADDLLRGAGVAGGLDADQRARFEVAGDGADGREQRFQVRFAGRGEAGRHADDDGVGAGEDAGVGARAEARGPHRPDVRVVDVPDVGAALLQARDDVGVDVVADGRQSRLAGPAGQREADVAEADHGDFSEHVSPMCPVWVPSCSGPSDAGVAAGEGAAGDGGGEDGKGEGTSQESSP